MATMTKPQLIAAVASKAGVSKATAEDVLAALHNVVVVELEKAGVSAKKKAKVNVLPGFLTIEKSRKAATKARDGRNPATGETIRIKAKPAHNVYKAKISKAVAESIG
jgi:nucleoid DNA-binding protein